MTQRRLINYVTFAILLGATAWGFQFQWGVMFIYWSANGIRTSHAFLLSSVSRVEDPILFWLIQAAWIGFGVWLILADFGKFLA